MSPMSLMLIVMLVTMIGLAVVDHIQQSKLIKDIEERLDKLLKDIEERRK